MVDRIQGRGAAFNPGNRFEQLHIDDLSQDRETSGPREIETQYYVDATRSILARNDSPDVPFTFSVNPYRGCEHGCIYCYARPTHEYLGFSSGLDFESRILVKKNAPQLLEEALRDPAFEPQVIALSGNTDCYQPAEKKLRITRGCLEVFLRYRNPTGVITKNAMVVRDIDILKEMTEWSLACVTLSITTLDPHLASRMEPRAASPEKRLETIRLLSEAGIPAGVNVAPVIPGLTDNEMPEILKRAVDCGALYAGYIMMRLPYAVKDLFQEWLQREIPLRAEKVLGRIRDVRGGHLTDPRFNSRMSGQGEFAKAIEALFDSTCRKLDLNETRIKLSTEHFLRAGQMPLGFD
jgi:DNA repair photolyase